MPRRALFVRPVVYCQAADEWFSYHSALHALGGLHLASGEVLPRSLKQGFLRVGGFSPAQAIVTTFEDPALGPLIQTPNGKEWARNPIDDDAEDFRAKWLRWSDGNRDGLFVRSYLDDEIVLANTGWPRAVVPDELAASRSREVRMCFMRAPLDPFPHGENPEIDE